MNIDQLSQHILIGALKVPRFIGGPIDGFTDSFFRMVARRFSPDALMYGEIRHVAEVAHGNQGQAKVYPEERPLNFQMTAHNTDFIAQACERVMQQGVDAIDINIGCPATHIVRSGSGSALMGDLPRLKSIIREFRKVVTCPLTIKMRAGFKEHNALEVARLSEDEGIDALAVHPRLQTHKFKGEPDYSIVAEVKKAISIPVIVSGGINDFNIACKVYEQTGVDGFLIGRAWLGNPWLLHVMQEEAAGRSFSISSATVVDTVLAHMALIERFAPDKAVMLMKRQLSLYCRGYEGAASIRRDLADAETIEQVRSAVDAFCKGVLHERKEGQ